MSPVRRGGAKLLVAALAVTLALSASTLLRSAPAGAPTAVVARAVEGVSIVVSDLDRAVDFYTRVLDFEKIAETEVWGEPFERADGVFGARIRVATLRLGDETVELREFLAPRGAPIAPGGRSNDRSFQHIAIIVSDMDRAYRRLREHHVEHASSGPQRLPDWNPNAGGIEAFYFKDPDGHPLEILRFPEGKGDPKWRRPSSKLFLGIDHTAIVVADTETSLRFWRDALGLRVAGRSENWGPEQERLNSVFGARLRITALRAGAGPGVEFLEYLAPAGGSPAPPGAKANDLASTATVVEVAEVESAARSLLEGGYTWVSPGAVALPKDALSLSKAALVRDPDGHFVRLIQKGD